MRQLIGRKVVKDKELQYSVFGDDTEGYAVEICEISRFSREAAFFPGDSAGWCQAQKFAKMLFKESVFPVHLEFVAEEYIRDLENEKDVT